MNNQDDQSWDISQQKLIKIDGLDQDQLERVLKNMEKFDINQAQYQFSFKFIQDKEKFEEVYQQQINQQTLNYSYNQPDTIDPLSKFTKSQERKMKDHLSRQLQFRSFQEVHIFVKIYQHRLTQMEIEYHYKLKTFKDCLKVYIPKGQEISSFFTNQIFQMKTKLHLYYSFNQRVVQKIRYSKYFNDLIEKQNVAAQFHKWNQGVQLIIFYSIVLQKRQIEQVVKKNLLQHMSIITIFDPSIHRRSNETIFSLIISYINEKVCYLQKQYQVKIEKNMEKYRILIHDVHEIFDDAKRLIEKYLQKFIHFRLSGNYLRNIYNKVIRNHHQYPYLRLKYTKRNLYILIDIIQVQRLIKHQNSFIQLFKPYFQNVDLNSKITFYLKYLHYPDFISTVQKLIDGKNITIKNYDFLMNSDSIPSKLTLITKQLTQFTGEYIKKQFFEIFLKIVLKMQVICPKLDLPKNIGPLNSQIRSIQKSYKINSQSACSQVNQTDKSILQQDKIQYSGSQSLRNESTKGSGKLSNSKDESLMKQDQEQDINEIKLSKSCSHEKKKCSKSIKVEYAFSEPVIDKSLERFYDWEKRQKKLQRLIEQRHSEIFSKLGFKIYKLMLQRELQKPLKRERLCQSEIYLSTIIEKNEQLSHHFIDLIEFNRLAKDVKDKTFFIFYKVEGDENEKEQFVPGYVLKIL